MSELSLSASDSVEAVVNLYSKMIYRLAYAKTANFHDAEDILQEVFLKYAQMGKKGLVFDSEEHRKAWLIKVTVNYSVNFLRSSWHRRRRADELNEKSEWQKDGCPLSDTAISVINAVNSLPEKYRIVVYLFYYENMTTAGISGVLDIGENAVRTRLHRARERLKCVLKEVDFDG